MKKRVLILNGNSRVIQRAKSLDLEVVILQRENSPLNKKELSKADYYLEVDYHNTDLLFSTVSSFLVLMTRGIDGIRLGFWKNDDFKKYMKETLEIK